MIRLAMLILVLLWASLSLAAGPFTGITTGGVAPPTNYLNINHFILGF